MSYEKVIIKGLFICLFYKAELSFLSIRIGLLYFANIMSVPELKADRSETVPDTKFWALRQQVGTKSSASPKVTVGLGEELEMDLRGG